VIPLKLSELLAPEPRSVTMEDAPTAAGAALRSSPLLIMEPSLAAEMINRFVNFDDHGIELTGEREAGGGQAGGRPGSAHTASDAAPPVGGCPGRTVARCV
jgi:hypothetical protein